MRLWLATFSPATINSCNFLATFWRLSDYRATMPGDFGWRLWRLSGTKTHKNTAAYLYGVSQLTFWWVVCTPAGQSEQVMRQDKRQAATSKLGNIAVARRMPSNLHDNAVRYTYIQANTKHAKIALQSVVVVCGNLGQKENHRY